VSHLLRRNAPISDAGWEVIDEEARQRLAPALAARKLVDFAGPHGWQRSATNLGRTEALAGAPAEGVDAKQRRVLSLVELRAPFDVSRAELRDADFQGWEQAGITGLVRASPHDSIALGEDCERYPRHVAKAVDVLLGAGIEGPYGLALSPDAHTRVFETSEHGGYPLLDHLRKILGGPLVWAPGVEGGVVASLRGGDFLFDSGQDLSIGYDSHDADAVHLYVEESFSFRVATPEAAVGLRP
jgi:uncharacterized linocin/CFP29 family protein